MNWIFFLFGFLAFPVAIVLFVLYLKARNTAIPTRIKKAIDLQTMLRNHLTDGKSNDLLYLVSAEEQLLIRIEKKSRKTKSDTLAVELRNSDTNQAKYPMVRERLQNSGIEFEEKYTPKQQKPKCIRITYPEGGAVVVSAACTALEAMLNLKNTYEPGVLISNRDPLLWVKNPLKNA
jgi:hypothetical protein